MATGHGWGWIGWSVGESDDASIILSHEHDDFTWLPLQEALGVLSFDEGKELLKKAEKFVVSL